MSSVPIRRVARVLNGGTPTAPEENWGGGVAWATPVDLARVDGRIIADTERTLTPAGAKSGSTTAPEGSVIVSTRAPIGYTAMSSAPMAFNQGCKALVPTRNVDARFLQLSLVALTPVLKASGSGSTFLELSADALASQLVHVPPVDEQRRIADFLDDRVYRIDRIIAARREQVKHAEESLARLSYDCIRGATVSSERREAGLPWLGPVPREWPVLSVSSQFIVDLGKMLDEKRQTGAHRIPYLRNTNVQWDEISIDDLKQMDIEESEYQRYTIESGDLLICEGGQPGRSAIWRGDVRPLGYQKALHRARSRGRSRPEWLLECLRAAVELEVFGSTNGQTTIAHLTNEQLRGQRFPFPEPVVQDRLLEELHEERTTRRHIIVGFEQSIDLFTEYKSSLVTAAVTGELDVTTAGSSIPG